ncbi:MAG: phosphoribosylformylglycinamidine synthase subunit PurS [Bacteroidetes bacterium]|nr:phosphoribosylformylglycinamidine synthase subunit PurS [Bacteroidota bacterium]MCH8524905.1 phosphoribosylformylglycinamidine synthase subunit PurS [Balneolales bacterium]
MFKAEINVTLRKSILDPKGKAAREALHQLGYNGINDVRIGKYIELFIEAPSKEEAESIARVSCEKLLANEVMEDFTISITKSN